MEEMKSPYTGKVYTKKHAYDKHMAKHDEDYLDKREAPRDEAEKETKKPELPSTADFAQMSNDPREVDELWLIKFFKDFKDDSYDLNAEDMARVAGMYRNFQGKDPGNWKDCHNQRRHVVRTMHAYTNRRLRW